jgi:hemin uptake protein HemP
VANWKSLLFTADLKQIYVRYQVMTSENQEQNQYDMPEGHKLPDPPEAEDQSACDPRSGERVLQTDELFGSSREIWIDHNGERYRLRITRRNKLILQK